LLRHPEIESFKDMILGAIESPEDSDADPEDARVMRYYARIPGDRIKTKYTLWLRVVVKYVKPAERKSERTGLLSSAYFVRRRELET
jgi:hypothetical protein